MNEFPAGAFVPAGKNNKKMKKNFIYTVAFLLCGVLSFSSCEDLLNVESDRVEYEFEDWTLNDSVYSVLGILKSVQYIFVIIKTAGLFNPAVFIILLEYFS